MSNYRWNFLFGFLSSGPVKVAPEPLYSLICPTGDTYEKDSGRMVAAPLGLRRVQTALERAFGADAVVAQHPLMIEEAVGPETKVVGLSEMSPLGLGPVDTALSWYNTTWNRKWFADLAQRLRYLKKKFGFKVVVGGAGSWQLLERGSQFSMINAKLDPEKKERYGIDHVVLGECDKVAPDLFRDVLEGRAPEVIRVLTKSIMDISDIPEIREPTLTGLVECMRGCGRGCDFCAPNLRMKRDFPAERVAREASINIRQGYYGVWLQTEELTLYGCTSKDKWPNEDAIVELYEELFRAGAHSVGATHWTFAGVRAAPKLIEKLSKMNRSGPSRWVGVQPGLEYASPRLVKKFMPYKVKPFSSEEYPETVREGIKIMNQNYYYPACTLIVGHPGEEVGEVEMTINLIKMLSKKDRVHAIFAPLLFVDYFRPDQTMTFDKMHEKYWELYYECWKHNAREFEEKVWVATQRFGFIQRMVTVFGAYSIAKFILRFLVHQFRRRFGFTPTWAS